MQQWQIRTVCDEDIPSITEIYNHYVLHSNISFEIDAVDTDTMHCRMNAIIEKSPYLVVEMDGIVLGYAYAKPWKHAAAYAHTFESTIYLAHDRDVARCAGMGTALYRELISQLSQRRTVRILLGVPTLGNTASDALHQKLGFRKVATFEHVGYKHGQWLGITYWSLPLPYAEAKQNARNRQT